MESNTCAEIHLDNLAYNLRGIQQKTHPAQVIAVVKADAYGHGAIPVTRRLIDEGVNLFAVAQYQEAMELRDSGIDRPILIFGRIFPDEIPQAIKAGFRITLFGKEDIGWMEKAGQDLPAHVHVNVETGMGRIGVLLDREPAFFNALLQSKHCIWEGLYSHFSTSDEKDKTYANLQLSRFEKILSRLKEKKQQPLNEMFS